MSQWPKGVHQKHGSLYLVKQNKWHKLCRIEEGEHALYTALARLTTRAPTTLRDMFPLYLAQAELAAPTRHAYTRVLAGILLHTFGHMRPDDVRPSDVAQFLEHRKQQNAAVSGNRERAALSSVFEFAMRQGYASANPCRGVRRNKERPRKTLVSDADLRNAIDRAPYPFGLVLSIGYLTGQRMSDLILLTREQLKDDGIHLTESKTGKRNVIAWTPTLRMLIRDALAYADEWRMKKHRTHTRVLTNRYGQPLTQWGIISQMRRLGVDWSFRDLRPKAASDAEHDVIGHRGQMLGRYQRARKLRPVR